MIDPTCAVQVCADYSDASGGTTVSVRQFQRAMGGQVIAFQGYQLAQASIDAAVIVRCDPGLRGRLYRWAHPSATVLARTTIADAKVVVCHMLYQYHTQWAAAHCVANHVPYWVVPHGSLDPYVFTYRSIRKHAWLRLLGHRILHGASRVLFATQRELEKAQEEVGALPNASVVSWPTARVEILDHELKRASVRQALQLSTSERVLLYCGRLHSSKRVIEAIRAVGPLSAAGVSLLVIGPDGDVSRTACEALCRQNGWNNIHFLGAVYGENKFDYFKAADAFISLSHKENFGHTVAESLACGLPVILSPGVDLAGDLSRVGCGWMLSTVESAAVEEVLRAFAAADSSTLAQMGQRGQQWARTELSDEHFAGELHRLAMDDIHSRL